MYSPLDTFVRWCNTSNKVVGGNKFRAYFLDVHIGKGMYFLIV